MRATALSIVTITVAASLILVVTAKGSSAQAPPQMDLPVLSPSGVDDSSTMLRLTWIEPTLPDGTPSITGYEVQYREDLEDADWIDHVFDSVGTTTETTITGLKPDTGYWAHVRAVNADGEGTWSTAYWTMTLKTELTLALDSATYTVREGESITASVTVSPTADRDVAVTIEITDGSGATLSGLNENMLTIEKGQSSTSFTVSGDEDDDEVNGGVTLTLTPDEYEQGLVKGTPYTATVTIIDDDGSNSPPVITTTSPITVNENQTAVATLAATDPDDDPITGWSISGGVDGALFSLTSSGVLTFVTAPDFENPNDDSNDNSYVVKVTARDEKDDSAELTLTVSVTDIDEPPPSMKQPEFSASGTSDTTTMLLLRWTAPDIPEGTPSITGYEVQYRLKGETDWTDHDFDSATTTETTITGLASNTDYDAQVRAVNIEGSGDWSPIAEAKTAEARLTVAFSSATYTVGEGESATTTVTVTPNADRSVTVAITMNGTGATLSGLTNGALTIARGQSSAKFTVSGDEDDDNVDGQVTLTLSANVNDYVFTGSPSSATVTIKERNRPPVITTTSPFTMKENQTAVGTVTATDPNNDPITAWSISGGVDSTLFSLTTGGVLSFKTAPDYENPTDTGTDNSYEVEVTASDGSDNSAPKSIMVNVTDVDEPPPSIVQPEFSADGTSYNTSMLILKWAAPTLPASTPAITGYEVQYRVKDETDWTDHNFDSAATTQTTITGLASNTSYNAQVRAVNIEGSGDWSPIAEAKTAEARLTVAFSSPTYTVNEGDSATATVTVTPAADRNVTVTIAMTGTGATLSGLDDGVLTVARGQGSTTFTISADEDDDAIDNKVMLTLSADADGVSLGSPSTSTVNIIDDDELNNPPLIITTSPISAQENQTTVVTLQATDSDDDPIIGWSITEGADSALFNLTNNGVLSFKNSPDYENPTDVGVDNSYIVEVTASDGTDNSTPKTITVIVTDLNEPPTFSESTLTSRTIDENSPEGTHVGGSFTADDPEGDALTYELSGTGYENFTVDANGQITVASNAFLDFETQPKYTLELSVSDAKDADGNSDSEVDDIVTIVVNLSDVPTPPPMDDYPGFSTSGTDDPTSMLILVWTSPDPPNGATSITGYEVQYRMQGKTDWIDHDFDSVATTTQTTITGLASNMNYEAQVRAINAEGPGEWSPTSIAKTTEADLTIAFSAATYTVDEGGTATSTVAVNPTADRNVTVTIAMTGTGATLSGLTNGMLTIARGQSSATFTISGDEDNDDAMNDEVTLTLNTDDDGVSVGSPSTTTVTIIDDGVPNSPPTFDTTTVYRIITEDSPVSTLLGDPIAANDPEGDSLTYSLSGEGSELFNVDSHGQITLSATLNHEGTPSYSLTLSVRDGKDDGGNPDSKTDTSVTVNVTVVDVEEPPGTPTDLSALPYSERPATALDVRWTPPNTTGIPPITGYDVQYRLQGETDWIDHVFDSVGTTTNTTISNLESNTSYQVQVRAINDEGEGEWATDSGTTEKARLTIAFVSDAFTVDEGESATITVTVTPAADRNVTVTIAMTGTGATLSGLDDGVLTIARGQGSTTFTISADEDDDAVENVVTLTLSTADEGVLLGNPSSTIVTTIDNVVPNNPPVVTTSSPITVEENQTAAAVLEATDSDGDPIVSWSITGGADSALFNLTIDGTLSFNNAPDFENPIDDGRDNSYEVEVTASDGTDDSTPKTITIAVTDVNEPPGPSTDLSALSNSVGPATALDVRWTPPNTTGIPPITDYDVQYRLQGETGWIDHVFDSVGTTTNTTISDLESNTTYQVQVRAVNDEGEGEWAPTTGSTQKADLTVAFRASTYTVDEGGTATVTVTVTPNADRNVTLTVSMTGTGATLSGLGTGNTLTIARGHSSASFDISGDQDDDAVNSEATLTLATDDDGVSLGSPSSTIVTTIDNEEPNNPPVVTTSSPITVEENQTAAAVLEATDSDGDPIVSWSITGGADSALFNLTIDGTLSFNNAPDFENPIDDGRDNGYEVEVTASDGTGDSTPKTINIAVTDVNEPPRFSESVSTTRRVTENSPEYTPVGGLFYADDPEWDPLVYELLGTGYENFTVDANGQITVASNAVLDFELQPTFILELSVSDTKDRDGNPDPGADDSVTITINLTDVVVPPQMDEYPGFSTSGTEDPTSMLTLTWTRPDLPDAAASITGYEVQYRVQGETVWVVHDFDSSATTIQTTITGLASNTSYDAQVRAINAEGPGEWSPTSIAKTTEADLTIAFSAATYTVDEGGTATSTVAVNPTADRNVTVTITMSGTGATLSDLDTNNALAITRGQSSATFTISGDEDDDDAIDNDGDTHSEHG